MKRERLAFFTTILMIFTLVLSSTIVAKTELEKKIFHLEKNPSSHFNIKLAKFDIYSYPKGFQKEMFFIPDLGDIIIDTNGGRVFEPVKFTKNKSTGSYTLTYKSLNPIEGSRVELKQLHNKWKLKAQWKGNTLLVSIPFKSNEKPTGKKEVKLKEGRQTKPIPQKRMKENAQKMIPLQKGISWHPGRNGEEIKAPRVQEIDVPAIRTPGLKLLGKAYQFNIDTKPHFPITISFPLPDSIKGHYERLVFLKISHGKEMIVFPSSIDRENQRASILAHSFSTYAPSIWDIDYILAHVEGDMIMNAKAEENPEQIYYDMTCQKTNSGEYANFVQVADGLGPFSLSMPLPVSHYGLYIFQRIIGYSDNFLFAGDPAISSPLNINGKSSTYHVTLNVIPTTSKMEGRVVDDEDNPMEGIEIKLAGPYDVEYKTRSHGGGRFRIETIGLTDPQIQISETMTYWLTNPEDEECEPVEGTVTLTAGQTYRDDLVYYPQGEIHGYVRDKSGQNYEWATIVVKPSRGKTITQKVNIPYTIQNVPIGEATVTAICPGNRDQQTKRINVTCKPPNGEEELTNFILDCSEGMTFYILHSGSFESDSKRHIFMASTNAEVTLFLPKGETEAYTEVIYPVDHVLRGKFAGDPSFKFSSNTFSLNAVVRWTVTKTVNRYGVAEYGFKRETIDRKQKRMKVVIYGKGDPHTVDIGVDAMVDPALMSPRAFYIKKGKDVNEFPFQKEYTHTDQLPHAPGGIPGGYIGQSNSQYRAKITIDARSYPQEAN
jgi:hypothetical protein